MGREQMSIEGRDDALAALRSVLRTCVTSGRLLVVRGNAGIGKTRLLEAAGRRWRARGTRVAQVSGARSRETTPGAAGPDRYGVGAVIDALRQDFDQFSDCGLVDGISALARFHQRQAEDPAVRFPAVAAELNWVFGRIGSLGPVAVLIDDVLEIADPVPLLLAARRPGCLVVASVRSDDASMASAELLDLADEVIDLDPLADEHIERLAGDALDESVHAALRAALGPLYGNPGTVLATVAALRERGRIVADGDRFRLDAPAHIGLPYDHDLLLRARRLGRLGLQLLATTAWLGAFAIDDLPAVADALGEDVAECGRTVDRLVEHGLLVGDVWGRLCCLCPALAASAVAEERAAVRCLPDTVADFPKPVLLAGTAGASRAPAQPSPATEQPWSATEFRIVELISMGLTNRRIGSALGLAEKTVESQLTRLFAKTGCRSRVELVTAANSAGRLRGGAATLGRSAA